MRTVTNSRDVYHLWANEVQPSARNSSKSVSFDGPYAYSYRAIIGRIVRNAEGSKAFLVTTRKWSVTTAKHQSYLRHAIPDGFPVFHLPDQYGVGPTDSHDVALADYQERLTALLAQAKRSRKYGAWRLEEHANLLQEANRYCEFFGLAKGDTFSDELVARVHAETEVARAAAEVEQAKAQEVRDQERRVKLADEAERWKAGESLDLWGHPDTFLRLNSDGSEVETSHGARVDAGAAHYAFGLYRAGKELRGMGISGYTVTSVTPEHVKIGCHTIPTAEVERFARAAGWDTPTMAEQFTANHERQLTDA